jgi:methylenetetrahydrofolate dehydrogenase (NADP+)/methenyltetrahydrofolate cyclohydrolase
METLILDGRALAAEARAAITERIGKLPYRPGLGVVLVGDDPASHLYVRLKERAAAEVGIKFEKKFFPAGAAQSEVIAAVEEFNRRDDIDGILVQLPLPATMNEDEVVSRIAPDKDADGFHPRNLVLFFNGRARIMPGLVLAIKTLIDAVEIPLTGKKAVVLANSQIFTRPVAKMLQDAGCDVETYTETGSASAALRAADIIVIAIGRAKWLTGNMIKPGATVIDVGTNKLNDETVGDGDPGTLIGVAGALSPVPGGVGPLTVAMLLNNVVELAERRRN